MATTTFNKAMIYDDNCPLCMAYTKAFVSTGLLRKENRISFAEVNMQQFKIDWQKAKHEIPLVDVNTGEVKYGVDALVEVLSQKICFIKAMMRLPYVDVFFKQLYKLVSYNRKIIVAKTVTTKTNFDCTPDYNFFWRWMLIIFCYCISNMLLINIATEYTSINQIFAMPYMLLGWMIIPICISMFYNIKTATDIHAHISISSVIAMLLLWMVYKLTIFLYLPTWLFYTLSVAVLLIFIQQIVRRYKYMHNSMML